MKIISKLRKVTYETNVKGLSFECNGRIIRSISKEPKKKAIAANILGMLKSH